MDKILAVFLILLILTIFAVGLSSPSDCPVKCEVLFDPVCGSNRQTYKTTCHLKRYNCFEKLREKVIVVHKGECLAKEDDETEPHKKKDVWISTQYIRGAVHMMKRSFHFVVAEKNLVRRVSHYFLYIAFLGGNALRHSLVM